MAYSKAEQDTLDAEITTKLRNAYKPELVVDENGRPVLDENDERTYTTAAKKPLLHPSDEVLLSKAALADTTFRGASSIEVLPSDPGVLRVRVTTVEIHTISKRDGVLIFERE